MFMKTILIAFVALLSLNITVVPRELPSSQTLKTNVVWNGNWHQPRICVEAVDLDYGKPVERMGGEEENDVDMDMSVVYYNINISWCTQKSQLFTVPI